MNIPKSPLQWPAGWPRTSNPKPSRFGSWNNKPTIAHAVDCLERELRLLIGSNNPEFILSSNFKYKTDGLPYSNQRQPDDQGVAVYFYYNKKEMVIACDSFDKAGCNIYGIAKTIEAMRGIQRWGCSELMNRAFTGFQALPERETGTVWYEFMDLPADADEETIRKRYRELSKTMHPDKGGSTTMFQMLQDVYQDALKQFETVQQ